LNVGAGADAIIDAPQEDVPAPPVASPVQTGRDYNPLLTIAVAAFIALLAGSVYLGWQRSVAGLPYSQQLWEKTVRLATWAGHGPRSSRAPGCLEAPCSAASRSTSARTSDSTLPLIKYSRAPSFRAQCRTDASSSPLKTTTGTRADCS